jgi:hypothetical protein
MLKHCVIAMCLMMIGSAFWMPAEVDALYICLPGKPCKTGSVDVPGEGITKGAITSVWVVLKPQNDQGVFLVCRNRGGTVGSGKAFLPSDVDLTGLDADKPDSVDKKGKYTFFTDGIVPAGIHPEYTPEQCSADPACAAIQLFCPNGGSNGNDGKNWVPIDITPIAFLAQGFTYYCDSDQGVHMCTCNPGLDAEDSGPVSSISATSGPVNRCASAIVGSNPSTKTFTFAWTDVSGPLTPGVPDGRTDHYDIVPFDKSSVVACVLPNPDDYFPGASLPYNCPVIEHADLFPSP